jgi:hypothetical protein
MGTNVADPTQVVTVWAVTNREYSDGGIACLFYTEELAEQYADALNRAEYDEEVAEWAAGDKRYKRPAPYEDWVKQHYMKFETEPYQLWSVVPLAGTHEEFGEWSTET